MRLTEKAFERLLWGSRLVVLIAVAASMTVSIGMFFVATVDVVQVTVHMGQYGNFGSSTEEHEALRSQTVSQVVEVIDGYLLATIMLIFAFGLYELFISRINAAEGNNMASRILLIHSLDDLKDRLAKVVLLILVVKFFKHALHLSFSLPVDLLYLSIGIALIAGALYLSHKAGALGSGVSSGHESLGDAS
jgi:uncharacterized membrane protein YqhA